MSLTANREVDHYVDQELRSFQVAASKHIYKGALVGLSSTCYAQPLTATSNSYVGYVGDAPTSGEIILRLDTLRSAP